MDATDSMTVMFFYAAVILVSSDRTSTMFFFVPNDVIWRHHRHFVCLLKCISPKIIYGPQRVNGYKIVIGRKGLIFSYRPQRVNFFSYRPQRVNFKYMSFKGLIIS